VGARPLFRRQLQEEILAVKYPAAAVQEPSADVTAIHEVLPLSEQHDPVKARWD
jgi:hypothetical protein